MPSELLERFILDPISEGGVSPLEVTGGMVPDPDGHGIGLLEIAFPRPETQRQWAGSRDTEGERPATKPRYMNRKIPVTVWGFEGLGIGPATNLVTNPSFETGTSGWATTGGALVSGGTLTQAQQGYAGEFAGNLVASAADRGAGTNATLASGTAYTLRFAARKITGSVASLAVARATTGLGTVSLSSDWQIYEVAVPATTAGAHFFNWRANAAGTFQIDAVCLTAGADSTPYFDGDTPGCSWSGTAHGSTASRRGSGSDLKRFIDCIYDLESKLEKLARERGTAKRYTPDGTAVAFDVLDASYPADWQRTISQGRMKFSFELTAKPFGRLAPIVLSTVNKPSATSIATVDTGSITGNAPALVRVKVTDTGTAQRNHLLIGAAQRSDPALLLAKTRQLLGGALANSPTTAATTNGGSTNGVASMALSAAWRPILSTNDASPAAYQTHEGPQRILARVLLPASNSAAVDLKFEWSQADLSRWSTSDLADGSRYVTVPANAQTGIWRWIDFGTINLRKPRSDVWRDSAGWRWEGRLSVRSASGSIQVDAIAAVPAGQFQAEMFANPQAPEPNEAVIGLGIASGSGSLAGSAATVGGNWSEIGGGTSYQRSGGRISRTVTTTDAAPKFARLGAAAQGPIWCQMALSPYAVWLPADPTWELRGAVVRYTDASNYVFIGQSFSRSGSLDSLRFSRSLFLMAVKAGSTIINVSQPADTYGLSGSEGDDAVLTFGIASNGAVLASLTNPGSGTSAVLGYPANADLSSGTLSSGGFGAASQFLAAGSGSRGEWGSVEFRSMANVPIDDAVIFPGRAAILSHDNALRYNAAGDSLGEIGRYQGDRLLLPPGASSRIVVLDGRVPPGSADNNLDICSIDVSVIPRVVDMPEPA
ncbi:MAG: hypothetical protein J0H98_08185 [Solirubrobacterales bacterium]|nr:hypothetical protein [Solirubrobacterales bacterium]